MFLYGTPDTGHRTPAVLCHMRVVARQTRFLAATQNFLIGGAPQKNGLEAAPALDLQAWLGYSVDFLTRESTNIELCAFSILSLAALDRGDTLRYRKRVAVSMRPTQ